RRVLFRSRWRLAEDGVGYCVGREPEPPAIPAVEPAAGSASVMDPAYLGLVDTHTPQHVMLIRLLIAAALGGMIGFEREAHSLAAGLRTHILIATAACLFTLLTFEIFHMSDVVSTGRADPIRAIEAVTAGIAFLGAGAIFQKRHGIQGLTTGAGMWLAGAVGEIGRASCGGRVQS